MRKVLFILLSTIALHTYGQDYVFKVMANKGSNMVRTSDKAPWTQINNGDALHQGYWVKVSEKAYLGLVHNSGKTAALEEPGEFEISSIESSIKNKKKGLAAKYTDFVFDNASKQSLIEGEIATRGATDQLSLDLPPDAEVVHSIVHLRWRSKEQYETFIITLKGIFDDVLTQIDVRDNYYLLDLNIDALAKQQTFIISISVKENGKIVSDDHIINRLDDEELRQMIPQPDESGSHNSMDFVLLASYYEENKLLIDASNFYQEAIINSPDVEDFKIFYQNFLKRHPW